MSSDPRRRSVVAVLLAWVALTGAQHANPTLDDLVREGRTEAVRELLAEAAPDLDAVDQAGWTALMHAVEGGHDEIVGLLLDAGANPDVRSPSLGTALHLAARHGRTASTRLLLQAGADLEIRDAEGRTPLYRAIERRHADVIELLQRAALARGTGVRSRAPLESPDQTLPPRIIESTPAPYTQSARSQGVEGTVVLMVLVRRDGSVGAANVSRGLEPSLDRSALGTVRGWKFAPAMHDGRTVEVVLEVGVEFRLPEEP
jgi:TonB family protein